jgi:hypothetical protein
MREMLEEYGSVVILYLIFGVVLQGLQQMLQMVCMV